MIPATATATSKGNIGGRTPTTTVPYKIIATGIAKVKKAQSKDGFLTSELILSPIFEEQQANFFQRNIANQVSRMSTK